MTSRSSFKIVSDMATSRPRECVSKCEFEDGNLESRMGIWRFGTEEYALGRKLGSGLYYGDIYMGANAVRKVRGRFGDKKDTVM